MSIKTEMSKMNLQCNRYMCKLVIALIFLPLIVSCEQDTVEIFVSTVGNDTTGSGSIRNPFASLERAREQIIKLKKDRQQDQVYRVNIREGVYFLNKTFRLRREDSGVEGYPVIYTAYQSEKVSFHGGVRVPVAKINKPTERDVLLRWNKTVRDKIVEIDLRALGITNYGVLRPVGFCRPYGPVWMELFVNGNPGTLARWPNDSTIKMGRIIDKGSVPRDGDFSHRGGTFKFNSKRPFRWKSHHDIWISGYFKEGWAEDAVALAKIDTTGMTFSTQQPSLYGFGAGKKFQRWYAYNILEEIDRPGEYYIDRTNGKLYLYPSEKIHSVEVSLLKSPLISLLGASHIRFEGVTFECARGMGIYMEETQNNLIKNCIFRNLGIVGICLGRGIEPFKDLKHQGIGIPVSEKIGSYQQHLYEDPVFNRKAGNNNGIVDCRVYNTGAGGIHLSGGNRLTLEAGSNYVHNCTIHDFNRIERSYRAGIDISGVGNHISHCELFNAPSMAVLLHGNNHIIEYNDIHHVCREVHDQGAIYYGRDPSEQGHKVYYNFFHHLNSGHDVTAVYHDDGACGMEVFGNIFYKPGNIPVLLGGGMGNPYTNNIFIEAELGIHVDNRLQNWASSLLKKGGIFDQRLQLVNYQKPPYSEQYPYLSSYWDDDPSLPKRNVVSKNIFYKVKTPFRNNKHWMPFKEDNWITDEDPGFVDESGMNFKLRKNAGVFTQITGFQDIPFENIGVLDHRGN